MKLMTALQIEQERSGPSPAKNVSAPNRRDAPSTPPQKKKVVQVDVTCTYFCIRGCHNFGKLNDMPTPEVWRRFHES